MPGYDDWLDNHGNPGIEPVLRHRNGTVCEEPRPCDYWDNPHKVMEIMTVIDQIPTLSRLDLQQRIQEILAR